MKKLIPLLIILFAASGCTGFNLNDGVDRHEAWKEVMIKKEEAKLKKYELEIAKTEQESNTEIVIDTKEEMQAYSQMKQMEYMGKAMELMATAIKDLTGHSENENIPMPKGWLAETIDSIGDGVMKVAGTPAAIAGATGYMVGKYSQGSEVNIQGDGNKLEDVGNDKSNRQYAAQGDNFSNAQQSPVTEEEPLGPEWACTGCSVESEAEGKCTCP